MGKKPGWAFWVYLTLIPTLLGAGPPCSSSCADYYVVIFATAKSRLYSKVSDTHSFATFVKVQRSGANLHPSKIEYFTISWMPRTQTVNTWARNPEPGTNLDLAATLEWIDKNKLTTYMWGPYLTTEALFERANRHRLHLESGKLQYKTVTTGWGRDELSNCIYALTDVVITPPQTRYDIVGAGGMASHWIAWFYRKHLIKPRLRQEWLLDYLGLQGRKFIRKPAPFTLSFGSSTPPKLPD